MGCGTHIDLSRINDPAERLRPRWTAEDEAAFQKKFGRVVVVDDMLKGSGCVVPDRTDARQANLEDGK